MNVTPIGPQADWPPQQILEAAAEREWEGVTVTGWLKEPDPETGKRFWVSSSFGQDASIIFSLRCAEHLVLKLAFEE